MGYITSENALGVSPLSLKVGDLLPITLTWAILTGLKPVDFRDIPWKSPIFRQPYHRSSGHRGAEDGIMQRRLEFLIITTNIRGLR